MKLRHSDISIPAAGVWLQGHLAHAPDVRALAVILHSDTESIRSTAMTQFAQVLQRDDFATLTMDLLTDYEEARDADAYYNIPQMTGRLVAIGEWISHQPAMKTAPVGLVGMHTACAAAIRAAAKAPGYFGTVVCCAGRPDLAGAGPLTAMTCPVRFISGSLDADRGIIRQAYDHIRAVRDWQLIEGAATVFSNNATTSEFARLTGEWLQNTLPAHPPEN